MDWIDDIKSEIDSIKTDRKNLKKFGLLIGGIFLAISIWLLINNYRSVPLFMLMSAGGLLFLCGLIIPGSLKIPYKIWMGSAVVMGWFVSRIILIILFFLIVTTVGLIARLFKKRFLDTDLKVKRDSYWINKSEKEINYKTMY